MKTDKSKKANTTRTIVCRILNYKDKVKILRTAKTLKVKNIFINEDFGQATLDHRKVLWKKAQCLRKRGKLAYFQYRSIVVKRKDSTG